MKKNSPFSADQRWVRKKRIHYRCIPPWADGKSLIIFLSTAVSLCASLVSCAVLHAEMPLSGKPSSGLILWGVGVGSLLVTIFFYVKGLYVRFLDSALDVYY